VGRISLPAAARELLSGGRVRARSRHGALFLQAGGPGAIVTVDGRGRLVVPMWLRRAAVTGELLVGTHRDPDLVVVVPAAVLDESGDRLIAGET
jgi:DNA-binding transcriptional regulator/RsmH inhibitor MraZ